MSSCHFIVDYRACGRPLTCNTKISCETEKTQVAQLFAFCDLKGCKMGTGLAETFPPVQPQSHPRPLCACVHTSSMGWRSSQPGVRFFFFCVEMLLARWGSWSRCVLFLVLVCSLINSAWCTESGWPPVGEPTARSQGSWPCVMALDTWTATKSYGITFIADILP